MKEQITEINKDDLKIIYTKLSRKVAHLNIIWNDYLQLLYSDETKIDILKRSGQTFFSLGIN